jgi:hypothetical protein
MVGFRNFETGGLGTGLEAVATDRLLWPERAKAELELVGANQSSRASQQGEFKADHQGPCVAESSLRNSHSSGRLCTPFSGPHGVGLNRNKGVNEGLHPSPRTHAARRRQRSCDTRDAIMSRDRANSVLALCQP